ncbi:MAG: hypothetical protein AUG51_16690 [Acidobacteria bacterium 13_1_20CM_3_53_8]|nr:MAG: hypothetical protein AUG51_16690 [Acidobacteria bacterium 13_1_20CM_3_53_8]
MAFIFTLNRTFNIFWICYSIVAVELILIWNHVTQVYGPNGNISYPAQLLPLLIGVLGFIRICWLLYKKVTDPPDDCCDENGAAPEKQSGSATAPPVNRQVGLGLLASTYSPARAEANGDDYDESIAHNRSLGMRYMVAYLPWLSQFGFWKNPKGRRLLQSSPEEGSNRYNDSPLAAAQTSYHHSNDTDLQDRGVPSSTDTSPMIDMKSPTSVNYSPVMSYKKE